MFYGGGNLPQPSGAKDTNDLNVLRRAEVQGIFTQSTPSGDRQVNGINLPFISGKKLNITGDAYIHGLIRTPLQLSHGIRFPDGSALEPSISFINDPDTGFYRDSDGNVGFTSDGTSTMLFGPSFELNAPITTPSGQNLVLNPSGPSVDFTGHNLINVGGISLDPNRYEVIGSTVVTTNVTPLNALTITTVPNSAYSIRIEVTCANTTDASSSGGFTVFTKGKNIGGTSSVITPYISIESNLDASLVGCDVGYNISGSDIIVEVTGTNDTINWRAAALVTRQLF